jgi:hypothetical protein
MVGKWETNRSIKYGKKIFKFEIMLYFTLTCVYVSGPTFTIITLLASLNSCVNPWIYLAFNPELARLLVTRNRDAGGVVVGTRSRRFGACSGRENSDSSDSRSGGCSVLHGPHHVNKSNLVLVHESKYHRDVTWYLSTTYSSATTLWDVTTQTECHGCHQISYH